MTKQERISELLDTICSKNQRNYYLQGRSVESLNEKQLDFLLCALINQKERNETTDRLVKQAKETEHFNLIHNL